MSEDRGGLGSGEREFARNGQSVGGDCAAPWMRADAAALSFRAVQDADLPFLAALYASTRWEELAVTDWSDARKHTFLQQQFDAQHQHYRKHYVDADFLVIERDAAPIGRLYLGRWAREIRIVDIAFLPRHRRRGFGTALLMDLRDEAAGAGMPVTIHVEKFNPAMKLYERLGFIKAGDEGVYDFMSWQHAPRDQVKITS